MDAPTETPTDAALAAAIPPPRALNCALCSTMTEISQLRKINGQPVCLSCGRDIERELAAEQQLSAADLPKSVLLAIIGALAGAAVWGAVVVTTKMEVGYVALLVGYLAGRGAIYPTKARGKTIQWIGAGAAVLGLVAGKLLVCAYFVYAGLHAQHPEVNFFTFKMLPLVVTICLQTLAPFDAVWAFIALRVALALGRPTGLRPVKKQ